MRARNLLCLAAALLFASACADTGPGSRGPSPLGGESALVDVFESVERETGVPAEILATISFVETRLAFVGGEGDPHYGDADGHGGERIGVMALSVGGVRDTARAAELAGLSEGELFLDTRANVLAAAALLRDLAGGELPADLAGWAGALREYGGGGMGGQSFADEVLERIRVGWQGFDDGGLSVVCSARATERPGQDGIGKLSLGVGYPGALWNPAYSGNYRNASRGAGQINYVIIHTMQGSYAGSISWFKNPDANVSAHYMVRSSDGEITQMVDDADVAWHDGCFNDETIGIEHEGYVQDPGRWYTETMYMRSAELTAWLTDEYGIPKDRAHIMGHGEAPDCSDHTDPGGGWNWAHYMDLVQNAGKPQLDARLVGADIPSRLASGETAEVWFEFANESDITWGVNETRLGTQMPQDRDSVFYADGDWLAPNRATGADAANFAPGGTGRFSFTIRAPEVDEPTVFVEHFQLVQEGEAWFGPIVSMSIEVVPQSGDDVDVDPDGEGEGAGGVPEGELESGGCSAAGQTGVSSAGLALFVLAVLGCVRRRSGRVRGVR